MFFKIKHFALKYFIVVLIMHPSKTPLIYIRHNLKHNIYVAKKRIPCSWLPPVNSLFSEAGKRAVLLTHKFAFFFSLDNYQVKKAVFCSMLIAHGSPWAPKSCYCCLNLFLQLFSPHFIALQCMQFS